MRSGIFSRSSNTHLVGWRDDETNTELYGDDGDDDGGGGAGKVRVDFLSAAHSFVTV